jgi:hypothetical protein
MKFPLKLNKVDTFMDSSLKELPGNLELKDNKDILLNKKSKNFTLDYQLLMSSQLKVKKRKKLDNTNAHATLPLPEV